MKRRRVLVESFEDYSEVHFVKAEKNSTREHVATFRTRHHRDLAFKFKNDYERDMNTFLMFNRMAHAASKGIDQPASTHVSYNHLTNTTMNECGDRRGGVNPDRG